MALTLINFGRNVICKPEQILFPTDENELLDILTANCDGKIRVIGSRHSWSDAIKTDGTLIDMQNFNAVSFSEENNRQVTAGGGCSLKHLLEKLNEKNLTLPTLGIITKQTIAGAISTGTHGSGRNSLSHYITSLRVAAYDPDNGNAKIFTIENGPELEAARCSLGCLGIIIDVTLNCIPQYYVEESSTLQGTLEDAIKDENNAPTSLSQFYLLPHLWKYSVQERTIVKQNKPSSNATFYRLRRFIQIDILFHLFIIISAGIFRSRRLVNFSFRKILPLSLRSNSKATDRSDHMLTMRNDLFRHIEMEAFIKEADAEKALDFISHVLRLVDDIFYEFPDNYLTELAELDDYYLVKVKNLNRMRGKFLFHYPITVRRVLCDAAMISMSSNSSTGYDGDWYAISFISYVEPYDDFEELLGFIADSMIELYGARLHWGKLIPRHCNKIKKMRGTYPQINEFKKCAILFDKKGVFRNKFITDTLEIP
jgi:hypothetical protein